MAIGFTQLLRRAVYHAVSPTTVTSGAIPITGKTTFVSVTGTVAFSLANGTHVGQVKELVCTVAASTPIGTLTPASPLGYATILFNAVGESVHLVWTGTAWICSGVGGLTVTNAATLA